MADYLRDPCDEPSLSTGVVETLTTRTPAHAWREHPRFGRAGGAATARGDVGSAVHTLVFGGPPVVYVESVAKRSGKDKGVAFTPTDWSTDDAAEQRKAIRDAGGIPLLPHQRQQVELAAAAAARKLATLGSGKTEVTMLWQTEGVWCRGRADWLSDDGRYDVDLKTVDSAEPYEWARKTVITGGLDIQAALRSLGHRTLTGRPRDLLWLLQELEAPYATSLVSVGNAFLDLGERKVLRAAKLWRQCLDTNQWPGFADQIHYVDPPGWAEWDFAMREGAQQ